MDNHARLLKCALELFAARGYDAVGVQEIVDAAGITKPTLYHYFGNKQGLLKSLMEERFVELYTAAQEAAAYHHDLTYNLAQTAAVYFRFACQNPVYYRLLLSIWFAPRESEAFHTVSPLNEQQYALFENLFFQAAADHGNMKGRHQAYAATFLGMINTYIGLWLNGFAELNDELVHHAVHQFQHGIYS